jgi:uncharacterized protein (DUF952 family)
MALLRHVCPRSDWEAAVAAGEHAPDSLRSDGFVHFSPVDTAHESATRLFRGRTDLVALDVDEDLLPVAAVWEAGDPPHPDGRLFPHLYAAVPVSAVVGVTALVPGADGSFEAVSPPG